MRHEVRNKASAFSAVMPLFNERQYSAKVDAEYACEASIMTLSSGFLKRRCRAATDKTASIKYVRPSRAKRGTSFCQMSVLAGEFMTRVLDVLVMY